MLWQFSGELLLALRVQKSEHKHHVSVLTMVIMVFIIKKRSFYSQADRKGGGALTVGKILISCSIEI